MEMTLLTDWLGADPSGWLVSEKFDGWRVVWTGSEFVTRSGQVLPVPADWKVGMPDIEIDGELFAGRRNFNSIQERIANGFRGLEFVAFDAPSDLPFAKRVKALESLDLPAHCRVAKFTKCRDEAHWIAMADEVVAGGGEGIVGRPAKSKWEGGRSLNAQRWVPQDPAINRI